MCSVSSHDQILCSSKFQSQNQSLLFSTLHLSRLCSILTPLDCFSWGDFLDWVHFSFPLGYRISRQVPLEDLAGPVYAANMLSFGGIMFSLFAGWAPMSVFHY